MQSAPFVCLLIKITVFLKELQRCSLPSPTLRCCQEKAGVTRDCSPSSLPCPGLEGCLCLPHTDGKGPEEWAQGQRMGWGGREPECSPLSLTPFWNTCRGRELDAFQDLFSASIKRGSNPNLL